MKGASPAAPGRNRPADMFWTTANGLSLLRAVLTGPVLWMIWMGSAYKWYMFSVVMGR